MFQRVAMFALCAILAGCSLPRLPDRPSTPGGPVSSQPPTQTQPQPQPPTQTQVPGSGSAGKPAPIADLPISLNGQCAQQDDSGFREQASLRINDNVVQAVDWKLWVGRRGSCEFKQADFRQTQRRPHAELTAIDGSGCKLMIWRDDRRITLAHAGCQKRCSPGIYDEAWPVMFDPASGTCAKDR